MFLFFQDLGGESSTKDTVWKTKAYMDHHSSSLGATTSTVERFGLLNIYFPIIAVLNAACPILYFQFLHVVSYAIFPSISWSS